MSSQDTAVELSGQLKVIAVGRHHGRRLRITGFTLPGMMLLPGCSAGARLCQSASGPLFIQRQDRWRSS